MTDLRTPASSRFSIRGVVSALALVTLALGAAQYSPSVQARGFHGGFHGGGFHHGGGFRFGGAFIGGAIIGAALARPYYYGGYYPYYPTYYPPAYYPPAVYAAPATYVEQQPYYGAAPAPSGYAPAAYSAPQQRLTIEQRAQRLKSLCAQGLFTPQECAQRRSQLLREM